jgi:hypothetical protein
MRQVQTGIKRDTKTTLRRDHKSRPIQRSKKVKSLKEHIFKLKCR